ncbi:unnamed protein product [Ixodes hexagonus]
MSVENRPPRRENLDNSASRRLGHEEDANGGDGDDGSGSASPVLPPDLADSDEDDELPDVMTASYSEICLDEDDDDDLLPGEISDLAEVQDATQGINQLVDQINREEGGHNAQSRPHTLGLGSPSGRGVPSARCRRASDSQATSPCSSMPSAEDALEDSAHSSRCGGEAGGLSDLHGTLTYEGDMVNFVAEDLQEKIKLSSPVTKLPEGMGSFPTSRSSTPSLYKQLLTPQLGLVDPAVLADLEGEARAVAASVDSLLQSLSANMHSISSMTVDCIRLYERGMCKTCDAADSNIKASPNGKPGMYQLMAKHEEVSNSMKPLYSLANQVKNIKKLLDHFENAVEGKT